MARTRRVESVFLNIPYDAGFEDLYLAYIVGLTQLGLRINAAIAVPNQGRLNTIIKLIEESDFSIHDLSRIEYRAAFRVSTCPSNWASLFIVRTPQKEDTACLFSRVGDTGPTVPQVM